MSTNDNTTDFDNRPKMSTATSKPETMLATNNQSITENQILGFVDGTAMDSIKSKVESTTKTSGKPTIKKD